MTETAPRRPRSRTRDIRHALRLRAAPSRVYAALTSARELTRWWLLGAETEARNAGRLRMVWPRNGDGRPPAGFGERRGVFVDLEPARKVAWVWERPAGEEAAPALCSFFLLPRGAGCELSFVQAGFPAAARGDALYRRYARAWEDCLAKLKLYAESGKTCPLETLDFESARILARRRA